MCEQLTSPDDHPAPDCCPCLVAWRDRPTRGPFGILCGTSRLSTRRWGSTICLLWPADSEGATAALPPWLAYLNWTSSPPYGQLFLHIYLNTKHEDCTRGKCIDTLSGHIDSSVGMRDPDEGSGRTEFWQHARYHNHTARRDTNNWTDLKLNSLYEPSGRISCASSVAR